MKMLKNIALVLCWLITIPVGAQQLQQIEYFFDTDPGVGNGTALSLSAADSFDSTFTIPTTGLPAGFHYLCIRTLDEEGTWSIAESRRILVQESVSATPTTDIQAAEYFFDADPGVGNGTPIAVTPGSTLDENFNVSVSGLNAGYHILYYRVQDNDGIWSISQSRSFFIQEDVDLGTTPGIIAGEYFFDADPGVGNGSPIALSETGDLDSTFAIDITGLTPGYHLAGMRFMDALGTWSIADMKRFYVQGEPDSTETAPLTYMEYYIDADPGFGLGTAMPMQAGVDAVDTTFEISALGLDTGEHFVYVRAMDSAGVWSHVAYDTFEIVITEVIAELVDSIDLKCYGECTGSATVSVISGLAPMTYEWYNAADDSQLTDQTDSIATGLCAGLYYAVVKDVSDLADTLYFEITQPDELVVNTTVLDATCGEANGAILNSITGGTGEYFFMWENGLMDPNITQIKGGLYRYVVADENGCSQIDSITVEDPGGIQLIVNSVGTLCEDSTGIANVLITGGQAPYETIWSNGTEATTTTGLKAGPYGVLVTDANGCQQAGIAQISNINGPAILFEQVTDVNCHGDETGSIIIQTGGNLEGATVEWSNGAIGLNNDQLKAGTYTVDIMNNQGCSVSKTYTVEEPRELVVGINSIKPTCGAADGGVVATVFGGTRPYNYQWSNGATTKFQQGVIAGVYSVDVTDFRGCTASAITGLSEEGAPEIEVIEVGNSGCGNPSANIDIEVTGGVSPYTYSWSTGDFTQDISGLGEGDYDVEVLGNDGCVAYENVHVEAELPDMVEICLVTVDSATESNLVVWEKPLTDAIDAFNIYRETAVRDVYELIGSVPYDSLSRYTDTLADPRVRAWRYKLSTVDSCGNESPMSDYHKTLHLTINLGLNNEINLIWDNYEGFPFNTYNIYRYSTDGDWEKMDEIPNNLTSWTDLNAPVDDIALFYVVESVPTDGPCIATRAENHNSSRSNRKNTSGAAFSGDIGVAELDEVRAFEVFPNPVQQELNVQLELSAILPVEAQLTTVEGKVVFRKDYGQRGGLNERLDVSNLENGIYILYVYSGDQLSTEKIIVNH